MLNKIKPSRLSLLLLSVLLLLSLCACAPTQEAPADEAEIEEAAQLTPLTLVLDWTPNVNHIGAYVALSQGWFAEAGLDVQIIEPGDNLALQLVAAGQAEFGYSYQEEVTYARLAGAPALSLAAVIQHNTSCFAAPAANNISTVADFQGKTYGGWGGEVEQALIEQLLLEQGLEPDVSYVNLGSADFFSATQAGEVDFSWIFYGTTGAEAEVRGVELDTIMVRELDPAFDYYTPVIVAGEDWLADDEHQQLTRDFLAALSRGYQYAATEPQQAAQLMCAQVEGLDEQQVSVGAQLLATEWQAEAERWGEQQLSVWQDFAAWLYQQGLIESEFEAAAAFSNDYLPAAQ